MKIEHLGLWSPDIERLKNFYVKYFSASVGPLYENPTKRFRSYFLTFQSGARLELMHNPDIPVRSEQAGHQQIGLAHLALAVGNVAAVDALLQRMASDGIPRLDGPRWTGDGYYEAVVLDPDGNRIEITAG
jgi:lactoylglutathione lyase